MTVVVMEVQRTDGQWVKVGEAGDPPGSISSEEASGRQVYLFGLRSGRPGVWRSASGFDMASPQARIVTTTELEQLSDLTESHEMVIGRGRLDRRVSVRFRAEES